MAMTTRPDCSDAERFGWREGTGRSFSSPSEFGTKINGGIFIGNPRGISMILLKSVLLQIASRHSHQIETEPRVSMTIQQADIS